LKKTATILLCLLYILPAIGFSVDIHWCGKNIKLVAFDSPHEKKCPCKKDMPSGCCKDDHVSVKLSDSQKTPTQLTIPPNNFIKYYSPIVSPPVPTLESHAVDFDFTKYHAPPFESKLPVYLANNIIRV
jgi:hypothetical protein